jgi:hypothetical protein
VVVADGYDATTIFDRIVEALPAAERGETGSWRGQLRDNPSVLADALEVLLEGPLDEHPILLIIANLDRILSESDNGQDASTPEPGYRDVLVAILTAFKRAHTESWLLMTSQRPLTLPDGRGGDLAGELECISLPKDEATPVDNSTPDGEAPAPAKKK